MIAAWKYRHIGSVFASSVYDVTNSDPRIPRDPRMSLLSGRHRWQDSTTLPVEIRVTFDTPQLYVSIDVRPIISAADRSGVGNNRPYLLVFGMSPAATMTAMKLSPLATSNSKFETWQTLDFLSTSATPDIGSIVFTCSHTTTVPSVFGLFDRLRFAHHLPMTSPERLG